jgi:hypothetical protein
MPFWSMVAFMVKWVIASIPAFLILTVMSSAAYFAFLSVTRVDLEDTVLSSRREDPKTTQPELYKTGSYEEGFVSHHAGVEVKSSPTNSARKLAHLESGDLIRLLPIRDGIWQKIVVPGERDFHGEILSGWAIAPSLSKGIPAN